MCSGKIVGFFVYLKANINIMAVVINWNLNAFPARYLSVKPATKPLVAGVGGELSNVGSRGGWEWEFRISRSRPLAMFLF